ncbi:hypothetical protein MLD38_004776 [Melastoma candidum]|uniref:Uncharacterized protein n=1 Tax=Melastoma candidum TaxID=119954 RepID=A0ACB9SBQ5_9MYRT|nr:hypothetical protein MLD38_004776 [Melastoma candidum]
MTCSCIPFPILFLLSFVVWAAAAAAASPSCDSGDLASFLSFLSSLSPPPAFLNWSSSSDCCAWDGVACDSVSGRIVRVHLPARNLNGTFPSSLLNLTRLSYLNLSRNNLSGLLPGHFFESLGDLEVLDLSYNKLFGEFPDVGLVNSIRIIDVSSNRFHGPVPSSVFERGWNLSSLNLSNNDFIGQIPSPLCAGSYANSSRLIQVLDFSSNNFSGRIPAGLGNCSLLRVLRASFNILSGELPQELYSAVSLEEVSLYQNNISGTISDGIGNLTNLRVLSLYSNDLGGTIPESIGKLLKLEQLLLHINGLVGTLPASLNNCTSLRKLILRVNGLGGEVAAFDFSPLQQLTTLDLGNNNFTGNLPTSLCSCKSLTAIRFATNKISGQLSPEMLFLESLSFLSVSNNSLSNVTGALGILSGLKNLSTLILSKNFLGEEIPQDSGILSTGGFPNLQVLALGGCLFTGRVPSWLVKLDNLEVLDLSQNQITGTIPGGFDTLRFLFYIDLSSNCLSGGFPIVFTDLPALLSGSPGSRVNQTYLELPVFVMPNNATNQQYNQLSFLPPAIYLYNNSLSGSIPPQIGRLKSLHVLDLSHNNFSGKIPEQLSSLHNLEKLLLASNHFTGGIPESLRGLHFLSSFSVAYNDLIGPIPKGGQFDTFTNVSFAGNDGLCGSIIQRLCPSSPGIYMVRQDGTNKKLVIGVILGSCILLGFTIMSAALWVFITKRRVTPRRDSGKVELGTFSCNSNHGTAREFDKDTSLVIVFHDNNRNDLENLTITEILAATGNFNQANIIGCGAFGLVYKATLPNGTKLAVKKLSGDMGLMEKEFKSEVEVLSNARHENLVSLQGYSIHEGSRLLIYSYMENGSLDDWLHAKIDGPATLDWLTRLKIAQGACCGLAYMHQVCDPHIVHRDIKSSNILLDHEFKAHVADFGLSRLILPYQTHVTTEVVGTLGYIPPEYAHTWIATLRGDVYSFGVVMLELLSGRRPVDVLKPKEARELVGWVQDARKEGKELEIFEPHLRGKGHEDQMLRFLDIACQCVNHNPFKRPTIKEVVDWLREIYDGTLQAPK